MKILREQILFNGYDSLLDLETEVTILSLSMKWHICIQILLMFHANLSKNPVFPMWKYYIYQFCCLLFLILSLDYVINTVFFVI